jgi:predicted PhzF superfamily epimerase YddE/YHI9
MVNDAVEVQILRVFVDEQGNHGNVVGIIQDTAGRMGSAQRLEVAALLGFSECVFIDSVEDRRISIFSPTREIPFAGHAAVGAAKLLSELTGETTDIRGAAGVIHAKDEATMVWASCELRTTPPWWHERLADVSELESLAGAQSETQVHTQLWAWVDEASGIIRSRTFAPAWGIPEDEANGSGCMRLAAALGRRLTVIHGKGSIVYAAPLGPGVAEVGGRVVREKSRLLHPGPQ